jgi:hypothetical protein
MLTRIKASKRIKARIETKKITCFFVKPEVNSFEKGL